MAANFRLAVMGIPEELKGAGEFLIPSTDTRFFQGDLIAMSLEPWA